MGISLLFFEETRCLKLNVWNPKTDGLTLGSGVVKRAHKFSGMHVGMSGSTLAQDLVYVWDDVQGALASTQFTDCNGPLPPLYFIILLSRPLIWWPIMESCTQKLLYSLLSGVMGPSNQWSGSSRTTRHACAWGCLGKFSVAVLMRITYFP